MDTMKVLACCALIVGVGLATPVLAQSGGAADAYINALGKVSGECESAAFKLALDNDLELRKQQINAQVAIANGERPDNPMTDANMAAAEARGKPFGNCVRNAPDQGAQAYKAFAAEVHDAKVRDAAKKVLATWLAYLPAIKVTSNVAMLHSGREYSALQEAISSFKVEAMTAD